MTTIGNLVTKFTVEGMDSVHNAVAQYGKEVEAAEKENKDFNKGLSAIGGNLLEVGAGMTAAAYIIDKLFIKSFTGAYESVDAFNRMTGESVEVGGKWQNMLEGSGLSLAHLTDAFKTLSNNIDMAMGSDESPAAVAFKRLGVSITDANGKLKDSNQIMLETMSALSNVSNAGERSALANDTIGRSQANINKLWSDGRDILKEYGETQSDVTENGMIKFKEYDRVMNEFNDTLDDTKAQIGEGLIPMLTQLVTFMNNSVVPAFRGLTDRLEFMGYTVASIGYSIGGLLRGDMDAALSKNPTWGDFLAAKEGSRGSSTKTGSPSTSAGSTTTGGSGTDTKTNTLMKSLQEEIGINLLSIQEYITSIDSKKTIDKDYAQDKKELDELVADTEVLINASKNQKIKDMWKSLKENIENAPVQAFIDIQAALTMQKGGGDSGGLPGGESKGWNLGGSTWNGIGVGSLNSEMWIFMQSLYNAGYTYQDALNYWGQGETPPGVIIGTGGIKGKASGGPVMAGGQYIVGEYGPELFSPDQNGMIIPNISPPPPSATIIFEVDGETLAKAVAAPLVGEIRVRTGARF